MIADRCLFWKNAFELQICERGGPLQKCKTFTPPKSARESARRGAGQKRGARGSAQESACPCVSSRNKEDEHFPEHFSEHPVSGRHLSEHSPEHFWGGWGFCISVGGRPVRNYRYRLGVPGNLKLQSLKGRKIRAPIKIKSALPPPQTQNTPPLKRGSLWTWGFPAERTHSSRRP